MRNRAIQINLLFFAPSNEVANQEFVSGETLNENIISDNPLNSPHHDALHPDPDEDYSSKFMFDDDSASIAAPLVCSSNHFSPKPSSSRPAYNFGLSSSLSEPDDEEIQAE